MKISSGTFNLLTALLTGLLFTAIPIYITNRRNKKADRERFEQVADQEESANLLEKSKVVDERLDRYIARIERENARLREENASLDDKLEEMREMLLDCKNKLRIAQSLLEQFQKKG